MSSLDEAYAAMKAAEADSGDPDTNPELEVGATRVGRFEFHVGELHEEITDSIKNLVPNIYIEMRGDGMHLGDHTFAARYVFDAVDPQYVGPQLGVIADRYLEITGESAYFCWHAITGWIRDAGQLEVEKDGK